MTRASGWIRGVGGDFRLVLARDLRPGELRHRVPELFVRAAIEAAASQPSSRQALRQLHRDLKLGFGWAPAHEQVLRDFLNATASGSLVALDEPRVVPKPVRREVAEKEGPAALEEITTWISLTVEDEQGRPLGGQRVRLFAPDGVQRERVSDAEGNVTLSGIRTGTCRVELIGLDASSWRVA